MQELTYLMDIYTKMNKHISINNADLGSFIINIKLNDEKIYEEFREFLFDKYTYYNGKPYYYYSNVEKKSNGSILISITLLPAKILVIDYICDNVIFASDGTAIFSVKDCLENFKDFSLYDIVQYNDKLYELTSEINESEYCFSCKIVPYNKFVDYVLKMYSMMYGRKIKDEENK